jgi:outer membrane murein-binding lipoprotein Lpp
MNSKDFLKICELKQEIQVLLKARPELRQLQDEIDKLLAGAGSQHNRCVLLNRLMHDKIMELSEAFKPLCGMVGELQANVSILRGDLERFKEDVLATVTDITKAKSDAAKPKSS